MAAATVATLLVLRMPAPAQADGIAWHKTPAEALEAAQESDGLVMLSLYTGACRWCRELVDVTWPAEIVIAKSTEFECVQANPDEQPVEDRYNDGTFPRILFLTAGGEIVHEVPGFMPPEPFVEEMAGAQERAAKLQEARDLEKQFADKHEDLTLAYRAGKLYLETHRSHADSAARLLSTVHERIGELDEASRADASLSLAWALLAGGQRTRGQDIIAETVAAYPDPAVVHRAAKLYLDFEAGDRALELLEPLYGDLEELDEELRPAVSFDYAIALVIAEQLEKGEGVLRQAIGAYPEHPRVWQGRFALGFALAYQDKLVEAQEQWQMVADGDPTGAFAERAQKLVEQVKMELEEQ